MSDDHDHGLAFDLRTLAARATNRRQILRLLAGASLLPLVGLTGCEDATSGAGVDATPGPDGASGGTCTQIPEETAGPYPGDGSNGVNVLTETGIVRQDIRASFGSSSTVAAGVPLTIALTIVDVNNGCAPLVGAAVYLWHCNQAGLYSLYSAGITNENYLRGVQVTDSAGQVSFTSIFPACYSGRWPHIHFEVYPAIADITASSNKIATSQLAMPKAACDVVYATSGYSASVSNLAQISLTSDNVFGNDSGVQQLASMSGSVSAGYVASLTAPVRG